MSNKGLVVVVLTCDELGNKIFTVSFSDGFGLRVENVGKIIMILLFGGTDFDVRDHVDARAEEDLRVFVDATNSSHVLAVLHGQLLKELSQWVEAMLDIVLVGIAAYYSNTS